MEKDKILDKVITRNLRTISRYISILEHKDVPFEKKEIFRFCIENMIITLQPAFEYMKEQEPFKKSGEYLADMYKTIIENNESIKNIVKFIDTPIE